MIHRKNFLKLAALAAITVITGGVIWAQGLGGGPFGHPRDPERMLQFMSDYLDLTPGQKEMAKATFGAARQSAEPVVAQLKQTGEQAHAAVKAGRSDAELRQIANSIGPLVSQLAYTHLSAMSKIYATLSQPQKDKLDRLREQVKERFAGPFGNQ